MQSKSYYIIDIPSSDTPFAVNGMFDNVWLHQYQPTPPAPSTSKNACYEDLLEALPEATCRFIGDVHLLLSNDYKAHIHINQFA